MKNVRIVIVFLLILAATAGQAQEAVWNNAVKSRLVAGLPMCQNECATIIEWLEDVPEQERKQYGAFSTNFVNIVGNEQERNHTKMDSPRCFSPRVPPSG